LLKNRNEVTNVLLTEYNAKHQRKLDRRDARAEGRAEGHAEGLTEGLSRGRSEGRTESIEHMLQRGRTPEEIAEFCGYDIEMVKDIEKHSKALP
jgi:predicted transposase YdaD